MFVQKDSILKKLILFTLLFIASTGCFAQSTVKVKGNKILETKNVEISDFRILEIGEKFEVTLVSRGTPGVYIETDSNLIEFVTVKVEAEKLTVETTRVLSKFKKLALEISYTPNFSKLIARGRTTIVSDGEVNVERMAIEAYDNATIQMNVKADRIDILSKNDARINFEASAQSVGIHNNHSAKIGANIVTENLTVAQNQQSKIEIQGSATKNTLFLLDSSNFYGTDLITSNTSVSIEGKSYAYLNVTDKLELKVSGESEVSLLSNPVIDLQKFQDEAVFKKIKKAPSSFKRLFE